MTSQMSTTRSRNKPRQRRRRESDLFSTLVMYRELQQDAAMGDKEENSESSADANEMREIHNMMQSHTKKKYKKSLAAECIAALCLLAIGIVFCQIMK